MNKDEIVFFLRNMALDHISDISPVKYDTLAAAAKMLDEMAAKIKRLEKALAHQKDPYAGDDKW